MPEQMIVIMGKPIAKARPRFATRGKFVKVYSAQSKEERLIAKEIKLQWRLKPLECPVIVEMTFLCPITKGTKKAVADMLDGTTKHVKRPDLSNYIKFYEDVFNGIVYRDDSQIFEVEAQKAFAQEPKTIIKVIW